MASGASFGEAEEQKLGGRPKEKRGKTGVVYSRAQGYKSSCVSYVGDLFNFAC